MITATDSLIEYLAQELGPFSIPVYWWRQTAVDEHGGFLKQDALNVQILGFYESGSREYALVSLDLLGSDERTVLNQLVIVRDLLISIQFADEADYADPDHPLFTGRKISWDGKKIQFINVRAPKAAYVHYNCTFPLTTTRE